MVVVLIVVVAAVLGSGRAASRLVAARKRVHLARLRMDLDSTERRRAGR